MMRTLKLTLTLPFLALLFPALALAGSKSYTAPGTYTFTVPQYTGSLTVTVTGGGGGGGGGAMGADTFPGGNGGKAGDVSFGSVIARGGLGGCGGAFANDYAYSGSVGAMKPGDPVLICNTPTGGSAAFGRSPTGGTGDGTASGGDTNIKGGGAAGGTGGRGAQDPIGYDGGGVNSAGGNPGGAGGKAIKTYSAGQLAPGTTVTLVVGTGRDGTPAAAPFRKTTLYNGGVGGINGCADPSQPGALGGCGGTYASDAGEEGQDGGVTITWTDASSTCPDGTPAPGNNTSQCTCAHGNTSQCPVQPALSCSVTFDQNPLTGANTTMRWTSTGLSGPTDTFFIHNVGYVAPTGNAQVSNPGDYTGMVTASGGAGGSSQTYTTSGTFTAPRAGEVTIRVIGGGGGGGGNSFNLANIGDSGTTGGSGGSGAATSITGSFGTLTASGGAGAGGGRMSNPPSSGCCSGGSGSSGVTTSRTVTLQAGEQLTVSVGGGGGGGGGGGSTVSGPAGGNGTAGSTSAGGQGGIGAPNSCTWYGNGHGGPAQSGGSGGVSSGGGGGAGSSGDNGNYGCAAGAAGAAGTLASGGSGGKNGGYYDWTKTPASGGAAPGGGGTSGAVGGGGGGGAPGQVVISWDGTGGGPTATCPATLAGSGGTLCPDGSPIPPSGICSGGGGTFCPDGSPAPDNDISKCSGDRLCTPTTRTCNARSGVITDNCGNRTVCPGGCSVVTNQCIVTSCPTGFTLQNGLCVRTSCPEGWTLQGGYCIPPLSVDFEPFPAISWTNQSFTATGKLQAIPSLVRQGETSRIYWKAINATSCTVTGSNNDGKTGSLTGLWNTLFSLAPGKTTSAITSQTVYTLICNARTGATPASVRATAVVNVIPSFQEI